MRQIAGRLTRALELLTNLGNSQIAQRTHTESEHYFAYDVFLSHNSRDKPQVRRLAERLRNAGLRVWFDEWAIKPGDDIFLAIEHGLGAARVKVHCLSPAALGLKWVTLERNSVLFRDPSNAGGSFVPLLLADCTLPDTSAPLQTCGLPPGDAGSVRRAAGRVPGGGGSCAALSATSVEE